MRSETALSGGCTLGLRRRDARPRDGPRLDLDANLCGQVDRFAADTAGVPLRNATGFILAGSNDFFNIASPADAPAGGQRRIGPALRRKRTERAIDGPGSDRAWGGSGADQFVFTEAELIGGTTGADNDVFVGGSGHDTLWLVLSTSTAAELRGDLTSPAPREAAFGQS